MLPDLARADARLALGLRCHPPPAGRPTGQSGAAAGSLDLPWVSPRQRHAEPRDASDFQPLHTAPKASPTTSPVQGPLSTAPRAINRPSRTEESVAPSSAHPSSECGHPPTVRPSSRRTHRTQVQVDHHPLSHPIGTTALTSAVATTTIS